jgi:hypothetical protein
MRLAMKRKGRLVLLFATMLAAVLAAISAASARDVTEEQLLATKVHRWHVMYQDADLGVVDGTATVDWEGGQAIIDLQDPAGGPDRRLTTEKLTPPFMANRAEFVLKGRSPNPLPIRAPDVAGLPDANASGDVTVKHDKSKLTTGVRQRDLPDETVTVTLSSDADGDLDGQWSYRADPITERNLKGLGRVGAFVMTEPGVFLGLQSGAERWEQLRPEIAHAEVVQDQTAVVNGRYAYVYPKPGIPVRVGARTIMLVGRNLPIFDGQRSLEPIESDDEHVTYTFRSASNKPGLSYTDQDYFEIGWQRLTQGMSEEDAQKIRRLEAVLVDVTVFNGVVPGVAHLKWGGAKAVWRVQFGDNLARLRVVSAENGEPTPVVFLPESVAFEIETDLVLPVETIKIVVATNDKALPTPLTATRQGPNSTLYRTAPLGIFDPDHLPKIVTFVGRLPTSPILAAGTPILLKLGDRLNGVADENTGLFSSPVEGGAAIYNDPSELGKSWHRALNRAAQLAGKPEFDYAHMPAQEVATFTHAIIFSWTPTGKAAGLKHFVTTDVSLGQHAAMLMLRDAFIDAMKRQLANLTNIAENYDAAFGWGRLAADVIAKNPDSVFAGLPAGDLDGRDVTVREAMDDHVVKEAIKYEKHAKEWRYGALRKAITAYGATVQRSIDTAAVDDTAIEDLLKLTGKGFEPVATQLRPGLMRFDGTAQRWVPDMVARGYIDSIHDKAEELKEATETSKIDTKLVVGIATTLLGAPGLVTEDAFVACLAWGGNGVIWGIESAHQTYETYKAKQEVKFAFGATAVLGNLRYEEAKLQDTEWWKTAALILGQGIMANLQGLDALSKLTREMAVFRGAQSFAALEGGVAGLRRLPASQLQDVQAFVMEAKALEQAGKKLTAGQMIGLATWEEFAKQTRAGEAAISEVWAKTMLINKNRETLVAAQRSVLDDINRINALYGPYEIGGVEALLGARVKDLAARRDAVLQMLSDGTRKPERFARVTAGEIDWLTSVQARVDVGKMEKLLADHESRWTAVKKAFEKSENNPVDILEEISAANMHQFVTFRRQDVDTMIDQVIDDVKKLTGKPLKRQAFGSTNLTSDYDVSFVGEGAELAVVEFNKRFRAKWGAESGSIFDTNAYTDPVYKNFLRSPVSGQALELGTTDLDFARQFTFDQMATRKYVPDVAWARHKALLMEGASGQSKYVLEYAFREAENAHEAAQAVIRKKLGQLGVDASDADALLRAQNDAYGDVLTDIDRLRNEHSRLDALFAEGAPAKPPNAELLDQFPLYKSKVQKVQALIDAKDLKAARALRLRMQQELAAQMRNRQGTALYFASEAYQTEGAIIHVVDELQGPFKRSVSLASLKAPPVKTELGEIFYINSFFENRANMLKEFYHTRLPGGGWDGGKVAAKGSKYFIRQLEAMKQAGVDLSKELGEDVLALTVAVDNLRADLKAVEKLLADAGLSGERFAEKIADASDRLSQLGVSHVRFREMAGKLSPQIDDLSKVIRPPGTEDPGAFADPILPR